MNNKRTNLIDFSEYYDQQKESERKSKAPTLQESKSNDSIFEDQIIEQKVKENRKLDETNNYLNTGTEYPYTG